MYHQRRRQGVPSPDRPRRDPTDMQQRSCCADFHVYPSIHSSRSLLPPSLLVVNEVGACWSDSAAAAAQMDDFSDKTAKSYSYLRATGIEQAVYDEGSPMLCSDQACEKSAACLPVACTLQLDGALAPHCTSNDLTDRRHCSRRSCTSPEKIGIALHGVHEYPLGLGVKGPKSPTF